MDKSEIEYVANLSKLILSESEKELFARQLSGILEYINKLNELETTNIKPMAYATKFNNVFREDKELPSLSTLQVLKNAPVKVPHFFFKVPNVLVHRELEFSNQN